MGPYYWLMDPIGVPDWVAQRLWMGTISLVALVGARWLFAMLGTRRAGAFAGRAGLHAHAVPARVHRADLGAAAALGGSSVAGRAHDACGPTRWVARSGAVRARHARCGRRQRVVAAPRAASHRSLWLVLELVRRAVTRGARGGWRRSTHRRADGRRVALVGRRSPAAGRLRAPCAPSHRDLRPWSAASSTRLTCCAASATGSSTAATGWATRSTRRRLRRNHLVVVCQLRGPGRRSCRRGRLCAGGTGRTSCSSWSSATIVGVGAWPYDDPSPYGRAWKTFCERLVDRSRAAQHAAGSCRSSCSGSQLCWPRPSVRSPRRRAEVTARSLVAALAFAAFCAGLAERLPLGRRRAARDRIPVVLDRGGRGDSTRWRRDARARDPRLELRAYRWGNTVEPVTPGLTDRPYLAREVLPYGAPQSVNLLDALDRRMQQGHLRARVAGSVRSLLRCRHRRSALRPRVRTFRLASSPRCSGPSSPIRSPRGCAPPTGSAPTVPNRAPADLHLIDQLELRTPVNAPDPPPVSLFAVRRPGADRPHRPVSRPVVLAGDGDGIVDASAAGLLDGNSLVLELAALNRSQLRGALGAGADLVLTDSNRRRIESWFASVRDYEGSDRTRGPDDHGPERVRLSPRRLPRCNRREPHGGGAARRSR